MKDSIVLILALTLTISTLVLCGWYEGHYSIDATVDKVVGQEILFVDSAGYIWSVYDLDYKVGDEVKLYFSANGTIDSREDDIIEKIR